ncbi:MAG: flagellar motor switch protein FliN [Phycisphaerales bacterium]
MADNDPSTPSSATPSAGDPASMAGDALKAAQDAVNQINSEARASAPDSATADALAAVQAALAEASKPASESSAGSTPIGDDGAEAFTLPSFTEAKSSDKPANLDLLADVNLNVKIELGRTRMYVEDVLRLNEGSVVELDKLAGDPVDIYVNERHVARGEVLVLNDNFCVRVNEIISPIGHEEAA